MKIALRLLLALAVALAVSACRKDTQPEDTDSTAPVDTGSAPVTTGGAADPRDFTDSRNFDNPESLLSKRVIYFDFDKSEVKAEYRSIVAAHAAYLASSGSARVTLESHADERGTREYNLGLSERRGNSVNGVLSAGGARGNQLDVVSYGEERPTCRVSNEDCWWKNRRVEIVYTAR
jgi:peptidoglycan-associated lipoprotein